MATSTISTTAQKNAKNASGRLSSTADNIPNYNVWTRLAKSALKGTAEYYNVRSQKTQLKNNSYQEAMQANVAMLNAQYSKQISDLNAENTRNEMYNVYRMSEHQAMIQGFQDAQVMHAQVAQTGASGTRIGVGSKKELDQTNELGHTINQNTLWENTISQANALRTEEVNYQTQGILQQANYIAQAYVSQGNAQASQIVADSLDPVGEGILSAVNSFAGSYMGQSVGGFLQKGSV